MPLRHHDLCFGCGPANLFGLQMELERLDDGSVAGRFFVKQDHQGPPGQAHAGILAAALAEVMSLAAGEGRLTGLEVDLLAPAPLGAFVRVEARVEREGDDGVRIAARALGEAEDAPELARASGRMVGPR